MTKFIRFPIVKKQTKECLNLREDMDTFGLREQIFKEEGNNEWLNYVRNQRLEYLKENKLENIVSICHLINYKKRK